MEQVIDDIPLDTTENDTSTDFQFVAEDSEEYINRKYNEIVNPMEESIKLLVRNEIKNLLDTQNKYVEKLIMTLEKHILFLKEENAKKDILIDKLLRKEPNREFEIGNQNCQKTSQETIKTIDDKNVTKKRNKSVRFYDPINFNDCYIDELNHRCDKQSQTLKDQLIAIRIEKHNDFLSLKNSTHKKTTRRNVILCGDSMISSIDSNGISSRENCVSVRSFSGATSNDMLDFCKPLANKKPDMLIVHMGTNDLTKNINNTKDNAIELIRLVKESSPATQVVFSSICYREDVKNINDRRLKLNQDLEKMCKDMDLKWIKNDNICLAKKKLHLNLRSGVPRLVKNFKQFLSN